MKITNNVSIGIYTIDGVAKVMLSDERAIEIEESDLVPLESLNDSMKAQIKALLGIGNDIAFAAGQKNSRTARYLYNSLLSTDTGLADTISWAYRVLGNKARTTHDAIAVLGALSRFNAISQRKIFLSEYNSANYIEIFAISDLFQFVKDTDHVVVTWTKYDGQKQGLMLYEDNAYLLLLQKLVRAAQLTEDFTYITNTEVNSLVGNTII